MKLIYLIALFAITTACAPAEAPRRTHAASAATKRTAALASVSSVPPETLRASESDEKTSRGVHTRQIKPGAGTRHPSADDAVVLYSQVYDPQGRVIARGQDLIGDPAHDLSTDGQDAIYMMVEGEIRRFWFPDSRGATKVTDYELVWISPQDDEPKDKP